MRDRYRSPPSPEVRALLARERAVAAIPAGQRARALARARAALAAPAVVTLAPPAWSRTRWVVAAAAGLVASAAIGAAAYEIRARLARPQIAPAIASAPASAPIAAAPPQVAPAAPAPDLEPAPALGERAPVPADAARAELHLLRQAHAAVARGDFEAALSPITAHARRFKNGRLAEEREALRVKSLAGLGRTDEARRAAASFRARFPRSVLLPAVSRMPASAP
jgi:hypothetical protein